MLFLFLALLLAANALAQDRNCDFYQNVQPGGRYPIRSPNYPNNYAPGVRCRWIGQCPVGYRCRLDCRIELRQTRGCRGDQVLISRIGDSSLSNTETYCGRQTLTGILSNNRTISVGLIVASNSNGGRFTCNLTAQAVPPPQQQCICGIRKQNDSGGPGLAQSLATGRLFSVGIVSFGDGCGEVGSPAVYTRVNEFLNWITTNAPGDYCVSE